MDCIKKEVVKVEEESKFNDEKPADSMPAASSTVPGKSRMVGFGNELSQLKDVLTVQRSSQQIVSIVGMGGTGKKISNESVDELGESDDKLEELGERLYKSLSGRRYLIVLDDMWSIELWDTIKFFFPENNNGSRVILTTRLSNVATDLHSFCIRINFLDEHESWIVFCQKAFGGEDCPPQLVVTGKKIVEQCKGLPLSITVIAGLLRAKVI
ncbi:hypothetical protein ACS0TY_016944 [Phlomoides rotata]